MSSDSGPDRREILRRTSRSFALSLSALPRAMREPVEVAYLLARAADTIADTGLAPPARRVEALTALRLAVAGDGPQAVDLGAFAVRPPQQADDPVARAEAALLSQIQPLLSRLEGLDPPDRQDVRAVLARLLRTMEGELAWFFPGSGDGPEAWPDQAALVAYTDGIAGCVGPFWMRLVDRHVHAFPPRKLRALESEARRYGRGLQLVNILRDLPRDLERGVCFLPRDELAAVGLQPGDLLTDACLDRLAPLLGGYQQRARRGLLAGLVLTGEITVRAWSVRVATALPAVLGLRTLEQLGVDSRRLDSQVRIRISRRTVRWEVTRTAFLSLLPKGPRLLV